MIEDITMVEQIDYYCPMMCLPKVPVLRRWRYFFLSILASIKRIHYDAYVNISYCSKTNFKKVKNTNFVSHSQRSEKSTQSMHHFFLRLYSRLIIDRD